MSCNVETMDERFLQWTRALRGTRNITKVSVGIRIQWGPALVSGPRPGKKESRECENIRSIKRTGIAGTVEKRRRKSKEVSRAWQSPTRCALVYVSVVIYMRWVGRLETIRSKQQYFSHTLSFCLRTLRQKDARLISLLLPADHFYFVLHLLFLQTYFARFSLRRMVRVRVRSMF